MSIALDVLFGLLAAGIIAAIAFAFRPGKQGKGLFALYAMIVAVLTLGGAQKHLFAISVGLCVGAIVTMGEILFIKWYQRND